MYSCSNSTERAREFECTYYSTFHPPPPKPKKRNRRPKNKTQELLASPPPTKLQGHRHRSNMPSKDILRIGEHALLLRLGDEGRIQDGLRDRLHFPEGGHKGGHVGVVGAKDELAGRDAVVEKAADLVIEDGAGTVVPESGFCGLVGLGILFLGGAGSYRVL